MGTEDASGVPGRRSVIRPEYETLGGVIVGEKFPGEGGVTEEALDHALTLVRAHSTDWSRAGPALLQIAVEARAGKGLFAARWLLRTGVAIDMSVAQRLVARLLMRSPDAPTELALQDRLGWRQMQHIRAATATCELLGVNGLRAVLQDYGYSADVISADDSSLEQLRRVAVLVLLKSPGDVTAMCSGSRLYRLAQERCVIPTPDFVSDSTSTSQEKLHHSSATSFDACAQTFAPVSTVSSDLSFVGQVSAQFTRNPWVSTDWGSARLGVVDASGGLYGVPACSVSAPEPMAQPLAAFRVTTDTDSCLLWLREDKAELIKVAEGTTHVCARHLGTRLVLDCYRFAAGVE